MGQQFDTVERTSDKARPTHRSLERGFRVLETIVMNGGVATLAEIARGAALPRSTVHCLLQAMVSMGYLRQEEPGRRYALSARVMQLAGRTLSTDQLAQAAMPLLRELCGETGESTTLAVYRDGAMALAAKADNDVAVRVVQDLGARRPVYCTAVGKALIAWLDPAPLAAVLARTRFEARTPRTILHRAELERQLRRVRSDGYAIDDEEFIPGVRCVAAPVFDAGRHAVAALGVVGPRQRITQQRLKDLRAPVMRTAMALSKRLGCG